MIRHFYPNNLAEEFAEEDALTIIRTLETNTGNDYSIVFDECFLRDYAGIAVDTLGLGVTNAASY